MVVVTKQKGLSLIEIMVAVAILAILALVAYPTYTTQVQKSRRALAKETLLETAQRLERCYTRRLSYALDNDNCAVDGPFSVPAGGDALYQVDFVDRSAAGFTLEAEARGPQLGDEDCRVFSLNSLGARSARDADDNDNDRCW